MLCRCSSIWLGLGRTSGSGGDCTIARRHRDANLRFLLVEDSARLQELLGETLRNAGYRLDVVGTIADLLDSAAAVDYDLVIVDLGLPDGDGLEAIQALRRH